MAIPTEYPFARYLAAKRSVDDRALNAHVFETLGAHLARAERRPPRVLEVGAGIGTMVERLLERGLFRQVEYTAIDALPDNLRVLHERLPRWAAARGGRVTAATLVDPAGAGRATADLDLWTPLGAARIHAEAADLFEFAASARATAGPRYDLLVANAVLDLVDARAALAALLPLLGPGGLAYLTINFDGISILEPGVDPELDELLPVLYARSIDDPHHEAKPPGDSRAGRHLFGHLRALGARVLAAGSSDWVIHPGPTGYTDDDAYFLHWLIRQFGLALGSHPAVPTDRLAAWIARRHAQVEAGELLYVAHQLDYLACVPTDDAHTAG